MKILDIYIIKKFLGTFFSSLGLILIIIIAFDVSEKIDNFIDGDIPLRSIVVDYYLNWIPYFVNLFSALFIFISVIWFTSKMAGNTELIAILSNGISFNRLLVPYFISAFLVASLSLILSLYIIPPANKIRLDFDNAHLRSPYRRLENDIHRQIEPNLFIYMQSYTARSDIGYRFSMEKFENGKLKSKLFSNYIRYDSTNNKWTISNYYIRTFNGLEETLETGRKLDTTLNMKPEEFKSRDDIVETMTISELNDFINKAKLAGASNITSYIFDKNTRFAYPFSIFILTLIGISLSSKKAKGGTGLNIGLGLLLSFSYIIFMRFSQIFALSGALNPIFAVWIPNILYSFIAYYLYRIAPK